VARQLILDLLHRAALGRDDFLVSESNAEAAALIDAWPRWPSPVAVLVGPPGSGKTHLAEVWRLKSGAKIFAANDPMPPDDRSFAHLIEDMPGAVPDTELFHLLNLARQQDGHVLITSRAPPEAWRLVLPDLASRLSAATVTRIGLPDDALLRAVLVKHCADRQLAVDEALIGYILARMPRSHEAVRAVVAGIDRKSLEDRSRITQSLIAAVLKDVSEPDFLGN
jgi:chromosomal replication initiation ATPase DnaA